MTPSGHCCFAIDSLLHNYRHLAEFGLLTPGTLGLRIWDSWSGETDGNGDF
jgi:hypothetical protein